MTDVLNYWLASLRAERTKKIYRRHFLRFLDFLGIDAEQVYRLRSEDLKSGDPVQKNRFENETRKYMRKLEDEKAGWSVRNNTYAAIRSFFGVLELPLQMRRQDAPRGEYYKSIRPFTREEIRKLLAVSDFRDRALILFMKDTGLAISDVIKIRLRDFEPESNFADWKSLFRVENAPLLIEGTRTKTSAKFVTFIGPETIEALWTYLEQRTKGTSYLYVQGKEKGLPPEKVTMDILLFREKMSFNPVSTVSLSLGMHKIIAKAGLKGPSAHSFRRFFEATLEQPNLSIHPIWIKRMMGHKLKQIERAYGHPSHQDLREAYKRAIPFLSVQPRHVDEVRLQSLEEEIEKEREERESLKTENAEMKRQIKELRNHLNSIVEARHESDQIVNRLFEDPEFRELIKKKLKQLT